MSKEKKDKEPIISIDEVIESLFGRINPLDSLKEKNDKQKIQINQLKERKKEVKK